MKTTPGPKVIHTSIGFFSICSLGLNLIVQRYNHRKLAPLPDFSETFHLYRDHEGQDVYRELFMERDDVLLPPVSPSQKYFAPRDSKHSYKDSEDQEALTPFVHRYFTPDPATFHRMADFGEKYQIHTGRTLAVCFRGTDKFTEVQEPEYGFFLSPVDEMLEKLSLDRILIQTDQQQFVDFAKERYGGRVVTIDEIPRTKTKTQVAKLIPEGQRVEAARDFLAVMIMMSLCKGVITHTGNVGRWIPLFRGCTKNLVQIWGDRRIDDL